MSTINKHILPDVKALKFAITSVIARLASGLAQLYAIKFFLNNLSENEYTVIMLLLGYLPIFVLFEFGISQTIQNKFNQRTISGSSCIKILIVHYIALIAISCCVANIKFLPYLLLSDSLLTSKIIENFSIGAALLILMSSNLVVQRVLILLKLGYLHSLIILIQSIMQITGLYLYSQTDNITQLYSIILYVTPMLIPSAVILILLSIKIIPKTKHNIPIDTVSFVKQSSGFFVLQFMSALLLAVDYFFLSMQDNSKEIVSYHIVTRFFYISHVVYMSYLIYGSKKISKLTQTKLIHKIKISTILIGFLSVFSIFLLLLFLKETKYMNLISEKIDISYLLIITGLIYFIIRVFADINITLINNLSNNKQAFIIYTIEIIVAIICMSFFLPIYGASGIYVSLSIAYLIGLIYFYFNKLLKFTN